MVAARFPVLHASPPIPAIGGSPTPTETPRCPQNRHDERRLQGLSNRLDSCLTSEMT